MKFENSFIEMSNQTISWLARSLEKPSSQTLVLVRIFKLH